MRGWLGLAVAAVAVGTLGLLAGCSRNPAGLLLVPTGVRPAPAVPTGGVWGYLVYDPAHYPTLDQAPYPPTRVELFGSNGIVDSLRLGAGVRRFEFDALPPGRYGLNVYSHAYHPATFGWFTISDRVQDVGDLGLAADFDSLAGAVFVIGTMAGFSTDELMTYSTLMDENVSGVWTYPGSFGSTSVPAGTYRFKFVTDASSTPGHLIGWGGDTTQVLTVPVTNAPVRYGTSAVSDLKVTFPSAGTYDFTFDERRLTFSIAPASAPAKAVRSGIRRIR